MDRMRRLSLVAQFGIVSLIPISLLGFVLGLTLNDWVSQQALAHTTEEAEIVGHLGIQPLLSADDVSLGLNSVRLVVIDGALRTDLIGKQVSRVVIWNRDYRIVYSDSHSLIGRAFPGDRGVRAALSGKSLSSIKRAGEDPEAALPGQDEFLQVYVPLTFFPETTPTGALQLYLPYAPVAAEISGTTLRLTLILAAGLLLLYALLFRIVAGASKKLRLHAEEKEFQALHDGLTGLPNRTLFHDRVRQAIRIGRRETLRVGVMLMDLDRFKEVNDTLGHHNGDIVLNEVAARLQASLRESDSVARLGGDEFAVLLPNVQELSATRIVAEKILKALERPFAIGSLMVDIGASIGIALYPEHGDDADSLLQRADVAMYVAKEAHSGWEIYAAGKDSYTPSRLELVGELRQAIEHDELVLYYQPKLDLQTHRVKAVEALARWQHPRHGLLTPDKFIPLAEHTGLIKPLTLHVLALALRQCRAWHEAGFDLSVALNLSMRDVLDREFPDEVNRLLRTWDVLPSWLELEITESTIMADPQRALDVLSRLSASGITLAIDDFGTGYSSLAYLKHLPVDEIKIDKSFVMQMATADGDAMIVRSIIDLGRNLGLQVVAEGVENKDVLDQLTSLGCDLAQGYFISRPVPPDQFSAWLEGSPYRERPAA
jgi:diguanylate cyclase (GGDEF)-like protein